VCQVADERLRQELASAVDQLRSQRTFGLVFEEHIPEFTRSPGTIVQAGSLVTTWSSHGDEIYRIERLHDDTAAIRGSAEGDSREVPLSDLVADTLGSSVRYLHSVYVQSASRPSAIWRKIASCRSSTHATGTASCWRRRALAEGRFDRSNVVWRRSRAARVGVIGARLNLSSPKTWTVCGMEAYERCTRVSCKILSRRRCAMRFARFRLGRGHP
jgi:hypothetical protein